MGRGRVQRARWPVADPETEGVGRGLVSWLDKRVRPVGALPTRGANQWRRSGVKGMHHRP